MKRSTHYILYQPGEVVEIGTARRLKESPEPLEPFFPDVVPSTLQGSLNLHSIHKRRESSTLWKTKKTPSQRSNQSRKKGPKKQALKLIAAIPSTVPEEVRKLMEKQILESYG